MSGQLFVISRLRDVIYSDGKCISPRDVESVLTKTISWVHNENLAVFAANANVQNANVLVLSSSILIIKKIFHLRLLSFWKSISPSKNL